MRLRAQLLVPSAATGTAFDAVERAIIQAQDARAARLGVRARTKRLTDGEVERERIEDRSFVRAWAMRGTIHLVASEDYPWIRGLVAAPQLAQATRRMAQEGMTPSMADRARPVLRKLLESGPATRTRMREELARRGIRPKGRQALVHLLFAMTYEGEIVTGPYSDGKETMVLIPDWLPRKGPRPPEHPAAELALRYLRAYGPATLDDFRWWSSLRAADARAGLEAIAGEIVEEKKGLVRLRSQRASAAAPAPVKLLPMWDHYHLGYRDRSHVGSLDAAAKLSAGGVFSPLVVADGRAIGLWKLGRRGGGYEVELLPFGRMPAGIGPGLQREVEAVGRFLGSEVAVKKHRIR